MTRIDHVDDGKASQRVAAVFEAAEEQFGFVPNIARAMGNSDAVAEGFIGTEGELFGSGALGHELLEKVSVANGCSYCVDAHTLSLARNVDAGDEELAAIRKRRFDALPERERVAVAAAAVPQSVPEERYEALAAEFDDCKIAEIAGTAPLFQEINLFADALEVDPDGRDSARSGPVWGAYGPLRPGEMEVVGGRL